MSCTKVLVTGATGFIGTRLCEKMKLQYRIPHRALVRNFTKAVRIARLGTEMQLGDLGSSGTLESALAGCDAVVHLAYGGERKAERNLIRACRNAGIKRFVHISSMAVHGPNPGPECADEKTATIGRYNEVYPDSKARAELIVQRAVAGGFPAVILRPTIVYGPYSPFVTRIVESARSGRVTLIDQGSGLCNAVYVDDVCDAIRSALQNESAVGKAFFVTGDAAITWKEFNLAFANMVEPPPTVDSVSASDVRAHWAAKTRSPLRSNLVALGQLVKSAEFHEQLGTVPALRSGLVWTKRNLKRILPPGQVAALKTTRPIRPDPSGLGIWPDRGRLVREDFHLEFSNQRAKNELGWTPEFDFRAGAELTRSWLLFAELLCTDAERKRRDWGNT